MIHRLWPVAIEVSLLLYVTSCCSQTRPSRSVFAHFSLRSMTSSHIPCDLEASNRTLTLRRTKASLTAWRTTPKIMQYASWSSIELGNAQMQHANHLWNAFVNAVMGH